MDEQKMKYEPCKKQGFIRKHILGILSIIWFFIFSCLGSLDYHLCLIVIGLVPGLAITLNSLRGTRIF